MDKTRCKDTAPVLLFLLTLITPPVIEEPLHPDTQPSPGFLPTASVIVAHHPPDCPFHFQAAQSECFSHSAAQSLAWETWALGTDDEELEYHMFCSSVAIPSSHID